MKIHPLGVELFHVGRRTDITKLTVAFSNFCECIWTSKNTTNVVIINNW